jgi:hypothetical protein
VGERFAAMEDWRKHYVGPMARRSILVSRSMLVRLQLAELVPTLAQRARQMLGIPLRPDTVRPVLLLERLMYSQRPGARCFTSWSTQLLPSGSLNEANEP